MIMPALSVIGEEGWTLKDPKLEEMIHQAGYPNPGHMGINPMDISDYNSNIDPSRMNCVNGMDNNNRLPVQEGKIPIIETEGKKMVSNQKEVCCGCGQPIQDRYLLRVVDNYWHEQCLRCAICSQNLTSSCFVKDGQLLCRNDYSRYYGVKCSRCYHSIPANDFVMRAMDNIYHLQCFCCVMCGYQLQKGDQFVVKDRQVYCRMDYEKEFMFHMPGEADWFPAYHPNSDGESIIDDVDGEGGKGPKRPRTILTTSQRRKFKASFEINPKPCRKVREGLAAETGLSVRVVQVWFQNQRAKMKKIARKQQQNKDSQNGKKTSPKENEKDDSDSDSDVESCGNQQGKAPKSSSDSTDLSSEPSGSNSTTSGCGIGNTSVVTGLEDVFMNQASQNNHTSGPTLPHGPVVNPIDKLYSMQTSYFNTE